MLNMTKVTPQGTFTVRITSAPLEGSVPLLQAVHELRALSDICLEAAQSAMDIAKSLVAAPPGSLVKP
jgi:hypothetical protein